MLWRNAALRTLVQDQVEVPDALVRKAYNFQFGPRYHVRLILVEALAEALAGRSPWFWGGLWGRKASPPGCPSLQCLDLSSNSLGCAGAAAAGDRSKVYSGTIDSYCGSHTDGKSKRRGSS